MTERKINWTLVFISVTGMVLLVIMAMILKSALFRVLLPLLVVVVVFYLIYMLVLALDPDKKNQRKE